MTSPDWLKGMRGVDVFLGTALILLIIGLFVFGESVAIGHVEEKTSYGLPEIFRVLGYLASGIIGALGSRPTDKDKAVVKDEPDKSAKEATKETVNVDRPEHA